MVVWQRSRRGGECTVSIYSEAYTEGSDPLGSMGAGSNGGKNYCDNLLWQSSVTLLPLGEPYAGKLHVRFDEGYPPKNGEARFEGSRRPSGRPPRGVPLYSTPFYSTEICAELLLRTTGNGVALASMEAEVTRYGSHTESRMRGNCTYGSMRGRAYPAGRPALLYTPLYSIVFRGL